MQARLWCSTFGGMRRLTGAAPNLALASVGALVVHQISYLVAHPGQPTAAMADHSYMRMLWSILMPLAVAAAALLILRQVRQLGYRTSMGVGRLGAMVGSAFAVQEMVESVVATGSLSTVLDVLVTPTFIVGLALAPAVAYIITATLRQVAEVVRRFVETHEPCVSIPKSAWRPAVVQSRRLAVVAVAPSRGPPRRIR